MRKKAYFTLILLLSVLFILAACGNEETGSKANDSSSADTDQATDTEKPLEFSISMRTLATPYVESHPEINDDKWVHELEKLTNTDINIRLVPHAEYIERMTLMLASGDIPDVVQASGGIWGAELAGAVQANVFMPLDDLLAEHGQELLEVIPQEAWDQVTYEGKIYAIPDYLSNRSRRATFIRMDLLEQTGLDIPRTTEEYLEVLRAFKELGVQNPYQGRENFKYADTFFGAFDAFPYQWEYYEGQVVPKFMAGDKIKDALEFYRTMYNEGLIHPEFLTTPQQQFRSNIIAGNAGMWSMNAEELIAWEQEIQQHVPEARVAIIPSPVGPDGQGGHYLYNSLTRSFYINNNTKADPAKLIEFFNWQVSEEAQRFFTYGIEGDTYTVENGEIRYDIPTDSNGLNEQRYRSYWLWLIKDATYTKGILELTEEGQTLMEAFDGVLDQEGRDSIQFDPPLESLVSNPDIRPGSDTPPDVWMSGAVRIILGREPIEYHDTMVAEWLAKGGQQAIDEATKRYEEDDNVTKP
ncbi:extracellular solute-binding protein [Bacillus horti]|uniref:Aldouronate transport system substrate-binding protein n=1 Tax=Caldalkalibacillus horti TaxID=77523 RepID=A0ABT9VW28_9BACI|nr:extracellular solute-binding protein [Bacillus horti]MDQ0165196.1 putative aldouronate transport system substrate-binding protein [Bacillus horti]